MVLHIECFSGLLFWTDVKIWKKALTAFSETIESGEHINFDIELRIAGKSDIANGEGSFLIESNIFPVSGCNFSWHSNIFDKFTKVGEEVYIDDITRVSKVKVYLLESEVEGWAEK